MSVDTRRRSAISSGIVAGTFMVVAAVVALIMVKVALDKNTDANASLANAINQSWTRRLHNRWSDALFRLNPTLIQPQPRDYGEDTK